MSGEAWAMVLGLAAATLAVRLAGLGLGTAMARMPRLSAVLDDVPGCILAALVGASLARGGPAEWLGALAALLAAGRLGVIGAMGFGIAALLLARAAGL